MKAHSHACAHIRMHTHHTAIDGTNKSQSIIPGLPTDPLVNLGQTHN